MWGRKRKGNKGDNFPEQSFCRTNEVCSESLIMFLETNTVGLGEGMAYKIEEKKKKIVFSFSYLSEQKFLYLSLSEKQTNKKLRN